MPVSSEPDGLSILKPPCALPPTRTQNPRAATLRTPAAPIAGGIDLSDGRHPDGASAHVQTSSWHYCRVIHVRYMLAA